MHLVNYWTRTKRFFKEVVPTVEQQRLIALILIFCQGGITVSGSIVRVTGSGLGCPTWPQCQPGSLVPVEGAAPAIHQIIEFGNRLLTFVDSAAAGAAVIAMYMACRRPELRVYAWLNVAGIVLQAVIGGISVHLDLRWWSVALHFLPSMVLVWLACMLYARIKEPDDGTAQPRFPQAIRILAVIATIALSIVLITGTMVTGSGVHSGDSGVGMDGRLDVDTESMAIAHAMCMYVYLIFTAITVFLLYKHRTPQETKKTGWVLIVCILIQWAVGVLQFYLGVPRWTVPFHIGMSAVVTGFTALLWAHGRHRVGGTPDLISGSPAGDDKYAVRQQSLNEERAAV